MIDRYPQMTLEYALKLLKKQYGPNSVTYSHDGKNIALGIVPAGEASSVTVILTIEQAKFSSGPSNDGTRSG